MTVAVIVIVIVIVVVKNQKAFRNVAPISDRYQSQNPGELWDSVIPEMPVRRVRCDGIFQVQQTGPRRESACESGPNLAKLREFFRGGFQVLVPGYDPPLSPRSGTRLE